MMKRFVNVTPAFAGCLSVGREVGSPPPLPVVCLAGAPVAEGRVGLPGPGGVCGFPLMAPPAFAEWKVRTC